MDLRDNFDDVWSSNDIISYSVNISELDREKTIVLNYKNILEDFSVLIDDYTTFNSNITRVILNLSSLWADIDNHSKKAIADLKNIIVNQTTQPDIVTLFRKAIISGENKLSLTPSDFLLIEFFINNPWKPYSDEMLKASGFGPSTFRKLLKKLKNEDINIFKLVPLEWYKLWANLPSDTDNWLEKSISISCWSSSNTQLIKNTLYHNGKELILSPSEVFIIKFFFENPWEIYSLEKLNHFWIGRGTFHRLRKKLYWVGINILSIIEGKWYYMWDLDVNLLLKHESTFDISLWSKKVTIFPSANSIKIEQDDVFEIKLWFKLLEYLFLHSWKFSKAIDIADSIWSTEKCVRAFIRNLRTTLSQKWLFINIKKWSWYIVSDRDIQYESKKHPKKPIKRKKTKLRKKIKKILPPNLNTTKVIKKDKVCNAILEKPSVLKKKPIAPIDKPNISEKKDLWDRWYIYDYKVEVFPNSSIRFWEQIIFFSKDEYKFLLQLILVNKVSNQACVTKEFIEKKRWIAISNKMVVSINKRFEEHSIGLSVKENWYLWYRISTRV